MNLGIVIAVSEYSGDAKSLPACREDGTAIAHVLRASNRFDDILYVAADATGNAVKQRLAEFAKKHQGKEIGEVFFYFTGHGEFVGDEFYYLLSDYQAKKRNQTSLENFELDGIVRALSPKLFVKIVDACQSGVSYIKTSDDFQEFLKSANKRFEKLYFMFSSQLEQFSYQDDKISYFTESILRSIFNHSSDAIRYKDVMSYVADEFKEYNFQTPLFVTQADFTEVFCEVGPLLKESVKQYIREAKEASAVAASGIQVERTLLARLRADANDYCSKQEALDLLSFVLSSIKKSQFGGELSELFSREVHADQERTLGSVAIGRWLDQVKDERKYFARVTRKIETYKRRVNPFSLAAFSMSSGSKLASSEFEDAEREVISGFSYTTDMPFEFVRIRLEPKLPNIAPEECYVVPLISRTHLRLFWTFSHFEYVDWDKSSRIGKMEWTTREVPLRDKEAIEHLIHQIEERFTDFVEGPLRVRLGLDEGTKAPESDSDAANQ